MELTQALTTIYSYLGVADPVKQADVIFICGGSSLLPVKKAAELYELGLASKIVVISNWGTFSAPETKAKGEAYQFARELMRLGVPKKDIYWQSLIGNSLEEAREALPFMQKHGLNPKTILLVDRPVHQRRAWATFTKWNPEIKFINVPADEPLKENKETKERVIAELERLVKYAQDGSLTKQEFPPEVLEAWKVLKKKTVKA